MARAEKGRPCALVRTAEVQVRAARRTRWPGRSWCLPEHCLPPLLTPHRVLSSPRPNSAAPERLICPELTYSVDHDALGVQTHFMRLTNNPV